MASRIERAVQEAEYLAGPGNLGYTQGSDRWHVWANGHGDCASFVITVCRNAGIGMGSASYTGDMKPQLLKAGWKTISIANRHRGCVLLMPKNEHPQGRGHTAICTSTTHVAEALANEHGTALGGKPGDQTGNEVTVRKYNGFAKYCFEPPAYALEDPDARPPEPEPPKPVPVPKPIPGEALMGKTISGEVYRLSNPHDGAHMYTTDPFEASGLAKAGWTREGVMGKTPSNVVPVYRLYNANTKAHLWTADFTEAERLIGGASNMSDGTRNGWQYEGEPFLAYAGDKGPVKVHRLYNASSGEHHYTGDANEARVLSERGWTDEGIAFSLDEA